MSLIVGINAYCFSNNKSVVLKTPTDHTRRWMVTFKHGDATWSTEQITTVLNFIQVHLCGKTIMRPYEVGQRQRFTCRVFYLHERNVVENNTSSQQGVINRADLDKLNEFIHRENHTPIDINQVTCVTFKGEVVALTRPMRHHDVIYKLATYHEEPTPVVGEQGFMTTKGVYLNRQQAYRLAIEHYLTLPKDYHNVRFPELYSEDIW